MVVSKRSSSLPSFACCREAVTIVPCVSLRAGAGDVPVVVVGICCGSEVGYGVRVSVAGCAIYIRTCCGCVCLPARHIAERVVCVSLYERRGACGSRGGDSEAIQSVVTEDCGGHESMNTIISPKTKLVHRRFRN